MSIFRFRWFVCGSTLAAAILVTGSLVPTVVAPGAGASGRSAAAPDPRPNIVLVTSDDQRRTDLGVMDGLRSRLAGLGTSFRNSYSSYPLCCPARASILTGQYAHNHHVLGNAPPWGGFEKFDDSSTVATWLQAGGYNTLFLGKYLNRYGLTQPQYIPPGWSDWRASIDPTTYRFLGTQLNVNGTVVDRSGSYQTDVFASITENLVAKYAPAAKPFFLWASYVAPHDGNPIEPDDPKATDPAAIGTVAVPNRYRNAMAGTMLVRDASFNEADVSDKPAHIQALTLMSDTEVAWVQESHQQRLESLLAVDDAIDRTLNALDRAGELANTLVIYTSDNGYFLGEHRRRIGKMLPYEPSVRVPLIIRGPGIPIGVTRTQPVNTVDLAATITDAANITPGLPADGTSLIPLAKDPSRGTSRATLLQAGPRTTTSPARFYTAIRTLRFLYVEYDTGERELYHQPTDPAQTLNVAASPDFQADRQRLANRLHAIHNCAGQTCPR
jgi:N-acetylglucosamine-6-sulfatase